MPASFAPLPAGAVSLMSARPAPDYAALGYTESEYVVTGTARSHAGDTADFATRVVLRRPSDPARFSGTLLAEWFNVSSGQDAAPDWSYLEEEILRRGHAWVGVSAQYAGVEGGGGSVDTGLGSPGLKGNDPGSATGTCITPATPSCTTSSGRRWPASTWPPTSGWRSGSRSRRSPSRRTSTRCTRPGRRSTAS